MPEEEVTMAFNYHDNAHSTITMKLSTKIYYIINKIKLYRQVASLSVRNIKTPNLVFLLRHV